MTDKKICILGLGYIGLPTSALLASKGYEVHGVDINQNVVDTINKGNIHIVEPELDTFVKAAINSGKLKADTKPTYADVFMIAVPTPFYKNSYSPNIDYVISATRSIASYIKEGNIVILESTSPVGTTEEVEEVLRNEGIDTSKVYIAHCPERVLPGQIMRELVENDRIVGGLTPEATKKVADFYRKFVQGEVLETDAKTAELCKLTENSFRDVNIAFANELSMLCDKFRINVWELIELANRHPRVNILKPGVGVGGHCIAVDPWFIVHSGGDRAKLIKTAREVNNYKTEWVIEKIKNEVLKFEKENGKLPKIACMGLTFKPDIDDLRESPALYIARRLKAENFNIIVVEPNIEECKEFELVNYQDAIKEAEIIVFLVAHKEFKDLDIPNEKKFLNFCGIQ
ncbi:UDP-N-acetyl-D-mannosaminuronic acid dehydrogenase [Nitratiruptor sp. YY08-26]|uniref:UDP-N-acetyl-D-mannosamine dehydrogenase n=1 Tax=unclassified Nitratiruptor TaxID=2624044 RepID=UPI00191691B4|nr:MULTISPECIES: UDP-N-acetyl-D-mannosamine dehydrogenase [unclassified Nitratiruptor]BCD62067.1 UDP-N-acetyl-D-mannosaminuronic acid dehydrogenase [Nitratiruptor sp. YY08-13]BCD66003.1 UDP-N-acetyl-D-mannosaminuronic acid dehydrogenase [Nitratiruptor sp. YY08-26]